jgi:hypothetical protein
MERQVESTVEADDLYHTAGNKGQAKQGGKKALGRRARGRRKKREPGRGHYDKDRPAIIAWVSRQGAVVIQATKDFTVKTVQKAAEIAVRTGSRLYTGARSQGRICGFAVRAGKRSPLGFLQCQGLLTPWIRTPFPLFQLLIFLP